MSLSIDKFLGKKVEAKFTKFTRGSEYGICGTLHKKEQNLEYGYYIDNRKINEIELIDMKLLRTHEEIENMKNEFRDMIQRLEFQGEEQ